MIDWDEVYAHVIASTGWTWEQVGDLTIPRLTALNNYWHKNPPVHLLVKWFIGYEPKEEIKPMTEAEKEQNFADFFAAFPNGV